MHSVSCGAKTGLLGMQRSFNSCHAFQSWMLASGKLVARSGESEMAKQAKLLTVVIVAP